MIIIIIKMTVDLHRSAACRTGLSERGSDHPRGPSDRSSSPWSSQTAPCTFAAERNRGPSRGFRLVLVFLWTGVRCTMGQESVVVARVLRHHWVLQPACTHPSTGRCPSTYTLSMFLDSESLWIDTTCIK